MLFAQAGGLLRVTRQRRLHEGAILRPIRLTALLTAQLGQEAAALELVEHQRAQTEQPLTVARRDQRGVKFAVPLHPVAVAAYALLPGQILDQGEATEPRDDIEVMLGIQRSLDL